jgi:type IV secretion system protein VirB10
VQRIRGNTDTNRQRQKKDFLSSGALETNTYLDAQRTPALAMSQEVKAGTIIPGVMISDLNSDLPGQIIAQVRENVYDSATGTQVLIPAGSRLVGTYDSGVTLGQQRALVGWGRLIYPDASSISLETMPGGDLAGYAGFRDKVDNHYARIFGSGLLLSVFSAGMQLSQPQSDGANPYDTRQIIAAEMGREMSQLGMEMTRQNMRIQPTIEVRPGYTFNVMVTKDMILPTWHGHPMTVE